MNIFVTLIQHKWTSIDRFIVTKHLILHAMYLEQKKKHRKLTKAVPRETSHLLRSELNEVALENILIFKDYINFSLQQTNKKLSRCVNKRCER